MVIERRQFLKSLALTPLAMKMLVTGASVSALPEVVEVQDAIPLFEGSNAFVTICGRVIGPARIYDLSISAEEPVRASLMRGPLKVLELLVGQGTTVRFTPDPSSSLYVNRGETVRIDYVGGDKKPPRVPPASAIYFERVADVEPQPS